MKTSSFLFAVIVAASALTACSTKEKPAADAVNTAGQETMSGTTADTAQQTAPNAEPDYLRREIDTNIKEGNEALQAKDYDRAERILLAALKQCDMYAKQEARQGAILNSLAAIYEQKEMYAQAVPLLNKAQKLFIRAFGRQNPAVYITLGNLGRVLAKQFRWQEAADVYQTAVNLMEEDPKTKNTAAYKDMLVQCRDAWTNAKNAFKANKIDAKLKAIK